MDGQEKGHTDGFLVQHVGLSILRVEKLVIVHNIRKGLNLTSNLIVNDCVGLQGEGEGLRDSCFELGPIESGWNCQCLTVFLFSIVIKACDCNILLFHLYE